MYFLGNFRVLCISMTSEVVSVRPLIASPCLLRWNCEVEGNRIVRGQILLIGELVFDCGEVKA